MQNLQEFLSYYTLPAKSVRNSKLKANKTNKGSWTLTKGPLLASPYFRGSTGNRRFSFNQRHGFRQIAPSKEVQVNELLFHLTPLRLCTKHGVQKFTG